MYIYFLTPCLKGNGPNSYSLQELLGTLWYKRPPTQKEDCLIWLRFIFFSILNFSHLPPFSKACHSGSFEYSYQRVGGKAIPTIKWLSGHLSQNHFSLKLFLLSQTWRWATGPFPAVSVCEIYLPNFFFKNISSWKPPFSHLWGCNRRRPIQDTFTGGNVFRLHLLTENLESVGMQTIFWWKWMVYCFFDTVCVQLSQNRQGWKRSPRSSSPTISGLWCSKHWGFRPDFLNIKQRGLNYS